MNVKEIMASIEGRLTEKEGGFLYESASKVKSPNVIVEIGSWKGRSAACLATGSKKGNNVKVYAIDPHDLGEENSFCVFQMNMDVAGVADIVVPVVKTSVEAVRTWNGKIGMLFIDGAHDYNSVETDFLSWNEHLADDGIVCFHDSTNEDGPNLAVKKYLFRSGKFRDVRVTDSITSATKSENGVSVYDRMRNEIALFSKTAHDVFSSRKIPAVLRAKIPACMRRAVSRIGGLANG